MPEENLDVLRKSIEAFGSDRETWLSTLDPGFEWYPLEEGHIPSRGIDAAIGIRERWLESWDGHAIEIEEIRDGGDDLVAFLHLSGRGKASGVEVDLRFYMHWKLRDGKIVYLYEYDDRDEALAAAGIEP